MSRPRFYKLDGHTPVPAEHLTDAMTGVPVAKTDLPGDVHVSTVFLGLDHNHTGKGPPLLFETMVFGGPLHDEQWRYCTWEEAEAGHKAAVKLATEATP